MIEWCLPCSLSKNGARGSVARAPNSDTAESAVSSENWFGFISRIFLGGCIGRTSVCFFAMSLE